MGAAISISINCFGKTKPQIDADKRRVESQVLRMTPEAKDAKTLRSWGLCVESRIRAQNHRPDTHYNKSKQIFDFVQLDFPDENRIDTIFFSMVMHSTIIGNQ
jgi:hypothetical protein